MRIRCVNGKGRWGDPKGASSANVGPKNRFSEKRRSEAPRWYAERVSVCMVQLHHLSVCRCVYICQGDAQTNRHPLKPESRLERKQTEAPLKCASPLLPPPQPPRREVLLPRIWCTSSAWA
jgi:hypothetical protein